MTRRRIGEQEMRFANGERDSPENLDGPEEKRRGK
jgi:hypothetical protein